MAPRRRFGLHHPFSSQRQPRKENHAEVARCQITQAEGAAGKISLRKFLEADQEGKGQVTDNGHPDSALKRNRTEERQVDEQSQNPIEDEVPGFIPQGNLIDHLENAELTQIGQDNNENNEDRKENCEPLHSLKAWGGFSPVPEIRTFLPYQLFPL
jgi:hypothetical protein